MAQVSPVLARRSLLDEITSVYPLPEAGGKRATVCWLRNTYLVYFGQFAELHLLHLGLRLRHTRSARASWAAVRRATGTRNGEHET
jgi:hypothetical protein